MKCYECEILFSFFHQMLKPHEADEVRSHVAECSRCEQVLEMYRSLDGTLDDWTTAEPSPWFDARLRARLAASGEKKFGFLGFGRLRTVAASVLSIVLIIGALIAVHQRQAQKPSASGAAPLLPQVSQITPRSAAGGESEVQSLLPEQQLKVDENLPVLEDYDMLANFDVLSELPQAKEN